MSPEDFPPSLPFRRALADLSEAIRELPADAQGEVFLQVCAELLRPMSREAVERLRDALGEQFPDIVEENEVMTLIAGHLAWREITEANLGRS